MNIVGTISKNNNLAGTISKPKGGGSPIPQSDHIYITFSREVSFSERTTENIVYEGE